MGWNRLIPKKGAEAHPLLSGVAPGAHVYFVHSFAAPVSDHTVAACEYGVAFTALVARGNFMGAQFHPEYKSTVVNPHPLFVGFVKAALLHKSSVN